MNERGQRIGILADEPLQQQRLRSLLTEAGFQVALCTAPQRISPALFDSSSIELWLVDADLEACPEAVVDALFGEHLAPIIFSDTPEGAREDRTYRAWANRLIEKIQHSLPPTPLAPVTALIDGRELAGLNTQTSTNSPSRTAIPLPSALRGKSAEPVQELWVLGASLGGPAAVKAFLDALPADLPCAFLYAQHIDAPFQAHLLQALGSSALTLNFLHDTAQPLRNGHLYLVPVTHRFQVTPEGILERQSGPWSGPYAPSIDECFELAASQFHGRCNAIVFSGMGGDALLGAAHIHASGGQVWTQCSTSCIQSAMPDALYHAGLSNFSGTPSALAHALVHHLEKQLGSGTRANPTSNITHSL
ncbi:chemotaxis protein CheB [Salinispirillum marinum]|uniref:protein-glutamate methylesterase n=2 Tax=Saccharospirillaceae TaxID=255527 RepID=A0ABV8BCK4_9GAMM